MEELDIQKYINDQANIEVENSRTWPTKVMVFYVAINFGIIGGVIAMKNLNPSFLIPCWVKFIVTFLIVILAIWVLRILKKTHINYLIYRNMQIDLQTKLFKDKQEEYNLPDYWFKKHKVSVLERWHGTGLYAYIVLLVTVLVVAGIFTIGSNQLSKANLTCCLKSADENQKETNKTQSTGKTKK